MPTETDTTTTSTSTTSSHDPSEYPHVYKRSELEQFVPYAWGMDANSHTILCDMGQTPPKAAASSGASGSCTQGNASHRVEVRYRFPHELPPMRYDGQEVAINSGFGDIQKEHTRHTLYQIEEALPVKFREVSEHEEAELSFAHMTTYTTLPNPGLATAPSRVEKSCTIKAGLLGPSEEAPLYRILFDPSADTGVVTAWGTIGKAILTHEHFIALVWDIQM